jgi:hypothetical protein
MFKLFVQYPIPKLNYLGFCVILCHNITTKVSMYVKRFCWILSEFISYNERG